jgi:hypothetical protein
MERVFKLLVITISALAALTIVFPYNMCEGSGSRMKVSRVRSDLRSLGIGLESYFVDHEVFPPGIPFTAMMPGVASRVPKTGEHLLTVPPSLTTPVGYLTYLLPDVWHRRESTGFSFAYYTNGKGWILFSPGPDQDYDIKDPASVYDSGIYQPSSDLIGGPWTYDPTNGTESSGDIWQVR